MIELLFSSELFLLRFSDQLGEFSQLDAAATAGARAARLAAGHAKTSQNNVLFFCV
jgi:hypothetical protein